ncbi:unnamed protein product [Brugia pahangi]|uniref:Uncharacterized protein n=1 Tax=Brugia pahangi TaxID=6280 RepID=A0A0N4TZG3_BRUPA|nr:unnamed protein product [Brugia pahangi]
MDGEDSSTRNIAKKDGNSVSQLKRKVFCAEKVRKESSNKEKCITMHKRTIKQNQAKMKTREILIEIEEMVTISESPEMKIVEFDGNPEFSGLSIHQFEEGIDRRRRS